FGDSYKAPPKEAAKDKGLACEVSLSTKKKGRIVAITAEDIQKRKNDVNARITLLLALPDEPQLRFGKYDYAKELWEPEQPTKEKVLEQMRVQLARDLEAKFAQENKPATKTEKRNFYMSILRSNAD
nr:hypothetical protein [Tanacetum cinerariifolium]